MVKPLKDFIQQSWLLIIACIVFGLLLAMINMAWKPKIDANKVAQFQSQLQMVIPGAKVENPLEEKFVINEKISTDVYPVKSETDQSVGFAFVAGGAAYDYLELVIVVDNKCEKILGYGVLICNETPGFGTKIYNDYFKDQFENIPAEQLKLVSVGDPEVKDDNIVAISGATITSQGVIDIFNNYIGKIKEQLSERGLI